VIVSKASRTVTRSVLEADKCSARARELVEAEVFCKYCSCLQNGVPRANLIRTERSRRGGARALNEISNCILGFLPSRIWGFDELALDVLEAWFGTGSPNESGCILSSLTTTGWKLANCFSIPLGYTWNLEYAVLSSAPYTHPQNPRRSPPSLPPSLPLRHYHPMHPLIRRSPRLLPPRQNTLLALNLKDLNLKRPTNAPHPPLRLLAKPPHA
jgi:hypothetical protein